MTPGQFLLWAFSGVLAFVVVLVVFAVGFACWLTARDALRAQANVRAQVALRQFGVSMEAYAKELHGMDVTTVAAWQAFSDFLKRPSAYKTPASLLAFMRGAIANERCPGVNYETELAKARQQKDHARYERSVVVALMARYMLEQAVAPQPLISRCFDEHFGDWANGIIIDTGFGGLPRLQWHFRHDHAWMLDTLDLPMNRLTWDGIKAPQRYEQIETWLRSMAEPEDTPA